MDIPTKGILQPRHSPIWDLIAVLQGFSGNFAGEYIRDTVGVGNFCVGEFWADLSYGDRGLEYNQDAARQALCDYLDTAGGAMALFDFPTKGILQEAVNEELWRLADENRKPPGLLGWWPKRAVTFIDNHDTGMLLVGTLLHDTGMLPVGILLHDTGMLLVGVLLHALA